MNYTYCKDDKNVWSLAGRIKDADPGTFTVCDRGILKSDLLPYLMFPHGYGKDREKVFYYDFDGITNWVRKADPASFISLDDGYFGRDDRFAFFGRASLPAAKVESWRTIGGLFSKDDSKIFYMNRRIKLADYDSFKITKTKNIQLATDKNNYYWNDNVLTREKYDEFFRLLS